MLTRSHFPVGKNTGFLSSLQRLQDWISFDQGYPCKSFVKSPAGLGFTGFYKTQRGCLLNYYQRKGFALASNNNRLDCVGLSQKMKDQQELLVATDLQETIKERQTTVKGRWYGAFDVLAWLNTITVFPEALNLELRYKDDKGEHNVLVDRCHFSKNPLLLLSNRLSVAFVGKVVKAELWVTSEGPFKVSVLESKLRAASVSADEYLKKAA